MKMDKIIIRSSDRETEESEHCPFRDCKVEEGSLIKYGPLKIMDFCTIKEIECKYGLTHIHVPKRCPLRENSILTNVSLNK